MESHPEYQRTFWSSRCLAELWSRGVILCTPLARCSIEHAAQTECRTMAD